jgi:carbon-monoxide dehydrogenase medium subunit
MESFSYRAPQSLTEAIEFLSADGDPGPRVLAGGTDLLVQLRAGAVRAGLVVDLKRIPELTGLSLDGDGLRLGAAVCAAAILEHRELAATYPGLADAVGVIGSAQVQGRASIGGNLCNASPAADSVPPLIALGAECLITGPGGSRTVRVESFVTGPGETALGRGEILVELRVPRPPPRSADAYLRFTPRTEMDIAVVGAAVNLTLGSDGVCRAARVALGAVAPTAIASPAAAQALVGTRVDEGALRRAAAAASAACIPIDDMRGTATFRRKLAGVLTRRAAATAAVRAAERG